MITKSEQCLTCRYFRNCDLHCCRDSILKEVKNDNGWNGLTNRYFKNGTISNNKIIDDLILALSTANNINDFRRTFFCLLSDDLSSPKNCVAYINNNNDNTDNNDISTNTIKW